MLYGSLAKAALVGLACVSLAGCRHCCNWFRRDACYPRPIAANAPPCNNRCGPTVNPYSPSLYPMAPAPVAPSPVAPAPYSSQFSPSVIPPTQATWQPSPNLQVQPPRPLDPVQPPIEDQKPKVSDFPVDIPQFIDVYKSVAFGLHPRRDGYDWLRSQGFKTVANIRGPLQDDLALKAEVEKRGMKYIAFEINPAELSRQDVLRFSQLIADRGNYPIFVTEKDGPMAGALWYLHFRLTEKKLDAEARKQAVQLGLREDPIGGEAATLWVAVQRILAAEKP